MARPYQFAHGLRSAGDLAADLYTQAVEVAGAIAAFEHARSKPIRTTATARRCNWRVSASALANMPPSYVRALFDQYAPRFDAALDYRAPELLLGAVRAAAGA